MQLQYILQLKQFWKSAMNSSSLDKGRVCVWLSVGAEDREGEREREMFCIGREVFVCASERERRRESE